MDRHDAAPHASEPWWGIFDPRSSLRARAALFLGGGSALFALLLATASSALLQRSLEQTLGASFETLAFQMSDKLDRVLHQRHHDLQFAASLAPFRLGSSSPERRQLLETLQDASRDFAWIGFADTDGRVRAATRGLLEGASVEMRSWFRLGLERPHVGQLTENAALARALDISSDTASARFLDLSVPVQDNDGRPLGVLGANLLWDWAREIQLSVIPESARRDRIGVTVYSPTGEVLLDSGGSGWSLPPDAPAIPDTRRFRGTFVEHAGVTYLTGFARSRGYRDQRGLGWLVVIRQPLDLALAPAQSLRHAIIGWGLAFATALFAATWLFAGRLARRLRGLATSAKRIRQGDVLTVLPSPRGSTELDHAAHELGALVEDLRRENDRLQEKRQRD